MNKTAMITGASRGIGLAIAKRCAKDGAKIVIAAKTVEENPKIPGTIYTAAKEIESLGVFLFNLIFTTIKIFLIYLY